MGNSKPFDLVNTQPLSFFAENISPGTIITSLESSTELDQSDTLVYSLVKWTRGWR